MQIHGHPVKKPGIELMNTQELNSIVGSDVFMETKLQYIEHYIIPLVTKKIKYSRYKP